MNHIFFLIPLLFTVSVALVPDSFAEVGVIFDRIELGKDLNGNTIYQWTSTPPKIPIGVDKEDNVIYGTSLMSETNDVVKYESVVYSLSVDKNTCVARTYDGGLIEDRTSGLVLSHKVQEAIFPLGTWNDHTVFNSCTVTHSPTQIIVTQNDASVIYDFFEDSFEWTYEYTNNTPGKNNHKYGFVTECNGILCDSSIDERPLAENEKINKGEFISGKIRIGNISFDTKNRVHDFANSIHQTRPGNIVFEFNDAKTRLDIGETLSVDPTFAYTTSTDEIYSAALGATGSACGDAYSLYDNELQAEMFLRDSSSSSNFSCHRGSNTWDISSIPSGSIVSDVTIRFDVDAAVNARNADITAINTDPRTYQIDNAFVDNTDADLLWDDIGSATVYVSNTSDVTTVATNYVQDLGTDADADLQSLINSGWFAIGWKTTNEVRDGFSRSQNVDDVELQVTYTTPPAPDAVDDLTSTDIMDTTVDLEWTQPNLNTGNLTGYQIKYDTPWTSTPSLILTNNTGSSDVTSQISGLTELTDYSFQIGVWTEGYNGTGNVLNVTTLEDFPLANYTLGFLDVNVTNTDIIQMFFERQDINSTALFLNVTYPNTYDLACNFDYEFANTNQTYTNLSNVTISATAVESSFQFIDVDNEIIRVNCWDTGNLNNKGEYLITQTDFPLLDQLDNFRNGTYGTSGQIGGLDLITVMVIIISFIGFNRINEAVGAIFSFVILGGTAFFGIIELPTAIFGGLAIVLMLAITTVKKQ